MKWSEPYHKAVALQRAMASIALDGTVNAGLRAKAALAWERLEERKRILKGKPLPGSMRPEPAKKPKAPAMPIALMSDAPDDPLPSADIG